MKPVNSGSRSARSVLAVFALIVALGSVLVFSTASSAQPLAGKKVYLVTCEPNVWCHAYNARVTQKLKAAGISVTQLSDNFDPDLQNQHMNQAIAAKPDAILIFASNADAIVPALKRAKAAGIPTVNLNARLKPAGEKFVTFEAIADNHALGRFAAMNLVEGMKKAGYDKGNVFLVTGTKGTLIVQDRLDEFYKYMKKYPQYKVVADEDGNWDQVKSSQLALQILSKYRPQGGIQGAYGMADYMAAGIIQAAQQLGVSTGTTKGATVVTASNCTPSGVPLMQQKKLYGNATQSPIEEADTTATVVTKFLKGQKVPKTTVVKEERFTQDTLSAKLVGLCGKWPT